MNKYIDIDALQELFKRLWPKFRKSFTTNIGMKIASVVIAIFVWSYVVSNDDTITRAKTISGVGVQVTGQTILQRNNLALLTDVSAYLGNISVEIDVPQSDYAMVTKENVDVELDLSNITRTGTQLVSLKASTPYGKVTKIWPASLEVQVEQLDTRYVPVNVELVGNVLDDYWYNVANINPSQITVSGPASVVQKLTEAVAQVDVTDRLVSFNRSATLMLVDENGEMLSTNVLSRTSASSSIRMEVFPTKNVPVSTEVADVFKGTVADGYEITGISISPASVTVAADASLLESLEILRIVPISASNLKSTYTTRATVSSLTNFENVSPQQVYVTIEVAEESISRVVGEVVVRYINMSADYSLSMEELESEITVIVTGPRSRVENLTADDLIATVDLETYGVGSHDVPIELRLAEDETDEVTFNLAPSSMRVRIEEAKEK